MLNSLRSFYSSVKDFKSNTNVCPIPNKRENEDGSPGDMKPLYHRLFHQAFVGSFMAAFELLCLGQICDRIRIYQQTYPNSTSILKTIKSIYKIGGIKEFYVGTGFNLLSHCGKHALRWCIIMPMDNFWRNRVPNHQAAVSVLSGISFALFETTFVKCPTESLKTKKMTRLTQETMFNKFIKVGPKILFNGWSAMLARQIVSWTSFRLALDQTTLFFKTRSDSGDLTMNQTMIVATIAGMINVFVVCPFDSVTTQMQKDGGLPRDGYIQAWKYLKARHGLRIFYSGWQIKFIRSTWYALLFQVLMNHFTKYQLLEE